MPFPWQVILAHRFRSLFQEERLCLFQIQIIDTVTTVHVFTTIPKNAFCVQQSFLSVPMPRIAGAGFEIGRVAMQMGRSPQDAVTHDTIATHPRNGVEIITGFGYHPTVTQSERKRFIGAEHLFVDG